MSKRVPASMRTRESRRRLIRIEILLEERLPERR